MKAYQTYIFDLDGTITNTMDVWLGIFRDGVRELGIEPPEDKILIQHTHDWKELTKLGLSEKQIGKFATFATKNANLRLQESPLHTGAYEMLQMLHSSEKNIAIFSAMKRAIFEPVMQHRNLYAFTHVAIAGTDVPYLKPHPAGILKALEDLKIPQEEYMHAVYIGDKDTDIQAAHNAGIDSILYYPPAHQAMYSLDELKKHNPVHIITDWKELLP